MGLHLLYSKHMEKFLTKKIRLRPRLQAAANMINGSHLAADIGCDHGRLSVALLQQGRADRVIASDISAPSLQKATELAARCGLGSRLTTVLSDGMAHLGPDEADAIAICGMGGELIARILEANLPAAKNARCITMQPMRGIEELRQFLRKNEFRIIDERLVLDAALGIPFAAFAKARVYGDLRTLARRVIRTWQREATVDDRREEGFWELIEDESAAAALTRYERQATLAAAMRALTERERAVIRLLYFNEATQTAAAAELGVSQQAVAAIKKRAIGKMREAVERG